MNMMDSDEVDDKYKKLIKYHILPNPLVYLISKLVSPNIYLVGRIAMGVAAAAYVLMVLMGTMVAAAVLGVGMVKSWAEEPVYVRESVQFDYSQPHPTAILTFGNGPAVPPAHTIYVSLSLLMPDSDYNRDIGIFQLSAELISGQGNVIARSSQASMLRFRSWPIRYARTFVMGVPLLLGMMSETQRLTFLALKHKEAAYPRTQDIRLTLIPRAGTSSLPHFYDAELLLNSRPPWVKEFVYRWKFTFCVWTTFYLFMMLLMFLALFLKPLIFPAVRVRTGTGTGTEQEEEEREVSSSESTVERWQKSRSKRKAAALLQAEAEAACPSSAASSITISSLREGSGDSESTICYAAKAEDTNKSTSYT